MVYNEDVGGRDIMRENLLHGSGPQRTKEVAYGVPNHKTKRARQITSMVFSTYLLKCFGAKSPLAM